MHSSASFPLLCVYRIARVERPKNLGCRMSNNRRLVSGQPQVMQQAIKQSKQFLFAGCRRSCKSCVFSSKLSLLQTNSEVCPSVWWLVVVISINQSFIHIREASHCCYCVSSTAPFCCERAAASAPLRRLLTFGRGVRARRSTRCFGV